jgi:hypothetical protein
MNSHNTQPEPELQTLFATGKEIQELPDIVRARALSRARASMENPAPLQVARPTGRRVLALAFAASTILLVGVAGAVVAIRTFTPQALPSAQPISPRHVTPAPTLPTAAPQATVVVPQAPIPSKHTVRPATPTESYTAELELLHRAQAAYAGRDFTSALAVVAEHRRRFPNGRLAEEREALRVRALGGAGRTSEARAAAASFAERFPRSVLLPKLGPEAK